MFHKWLKENNIFDFDLSGELFPRVEDREFWDKRFDAEIIRDAEAMLNYRYPVILATDFMAFKKTGERVVYEKPHFDRRRALVLFAEAEILENRGRFLPDIVNGIFIICEETYWGLSAHPVRDLIDIPSPEYQYIDLFAGETASTISLIYHILYEPLRKFCPAILERIEYEMSRRIIEPYLNRYDFWWMGYGRRVNNWNPWIISNIAYTFSIMEKNPTKKAQGFKKMLTEIEGGYIDYTDDGGCNEGVSYWTASGVMLFLFCEVLYRTSKEKINLFGDEKFKRICQYIYKPYAGNGLFAAFCDGSGNLGTLAKGTVYLMGIRLNDNKLLSVAREFNPSGDKKRSTGFTRMLLNLIYGIEIDKQPVLKDRDDYLLEGLQQAFVHSDNWFCALKGGNNDEGHNHNDIGSFILFDNAEMVLADPGCGVYTRFTFDPTTRYTIWNMQSSWHNLPEFNGVMQHQGPEYYADSFKLENGKTTVSFAGAYPKEAGISRAVRTTEFNNDIFELCDSFEFTSDKKLVKESFMTVLDVKIEDNRVILGNKYELVADKKAEISVEFKDFEGDEKLTEAFLTKGINRIRFTFNNIENIKFTLRRI